MRSSTLEIPIRGYHLDLYAHVNNARYLEFLEEARWAHYEGFIDGKIFEENNWGFVIVNINIDYKFPAGLGDVLVIESNIGEIKRKSVVFRQVGTIKESGKTVIDAAVTFVIIDRNTMRAQSIAGTELEELLMK